MYEFAVGSDRRDLDHRSKRDVREGGQRRRRYCHRQRGCRRSVLVCRECGSRDTRPRLRAVRWLCGLRERERGGIGRDERETKTCSMLCVYHVGRLLTVRLTVYTKILVYISHLLEDVYSQIMVSLTGPALGNSGLVGGGACIPGGGILGAGGIPIGPAGEEWALIRTSGH